MDEKKEGEAGGGLPMRKQIYAVAVLAALALTVGAFVFLGETASGLPQAAADTKPKLPIFVAAGQQLAGLKIQSVPMRIFHTEIVTDGYIAPNGGIAAPGLSGGGLVRQGTPILVGQSSDVLQAASDFVTARAQFQLARTNEKRQHDLYLAEGAALKDWQQAQTDLATASVSLASARNRLRILGKSDQEIASLERMQAGRAISSSAVFSVGGLSTVWLIANVREADAPLVHPGDQMLVHLPAFPRDKFQATISYVASVIDPTTHRLVVGAALQNPLERLRPNMLATFTILTGPAVAAPAVPQKAIVYEGDAARVWVAGRDGNIALREITVGRTNDDDVEVTKGLAAGERIVTSGALFIDRAADNG